MKKVLISILFLFTVVSYGQNSHLANKMSKAQIRAIINQNDSILNQKFPVDQVSNLNIDYSFRTTMNSIFSKWSSLFDTTFAMLPIFSTGTHQRSIVNSNYDALITTFKYKSSPFLDPTSRVFFNSAKITNIDTIRCTSAHVKMMKDSSLWGKAYCLYPFVGGTANAHKYNLKSPYDKDTSYRITWYNTVTHSGYGIVSYDNGTNSGYGKTHFNPAIMNKDSKALFAYLQDNTHTNTIFGAAGTALASVDQLTPWYNSYNYSRLSSGWANHDYGTVNYQAFWAISRINSTADTVTKNGIFFGRDVVASVANPNTNYFVLTASAYGDSPQFGYYDLLNRVSYIGWTTGLSTKEVNKLYRIVETYEGCLNRSNAIKPPADSTDYKATFLVDGSSQSLAFSIRIHTKVKPVRIYWGDGQVDVFHADSTTRYITHSYLASKDYTMTIMYPAGIDMFRAPGNFICNQDFLNKATNITDLALISGYASPWADSKYITSINITGLTKLKRLFLEGTVDTSNYMRASGSVTNMTDLEQIAIWGANTIGGVLPNSLKYIYIDGFNTLTSGTTPPPGLIQLEGMHDVPSQTIGSTINYDLTTCNNLQVLCLGRNNTIHGDLSNKPNLVYMSAGGYNYLTCDVATDPGLFYIGVGGLGAYNIYGSIENMPNLIVVYGSGTNISKPTTVRNSPKIAAIIPSNNWSFSSTDVNQILSDLWYNRLVSKSTLLWGQPWDYEGRYINLTSGSSSAPTGQGIVDKTNLLNFNGTPPGNQYWNIYTH